MFLRRIKNKIFLASLIYGISVTNANASGIPVLDMNALQQSIQNYQQQIKDYEEQIKQGLNQIQQMAEQGIGMQIDEILGQSKELINQTLSNLDFKLDEELFQETADVTNACAFLEQESEEFAKGIEQASKKLSNQVSTCINTVTTEVIDQTISKLEAEFQAIMLIPEKLEESLEIKTKIDNIKQAAAIVSEQAINNSASRIQVMLEAFENGDKENPYSKKKMQEDIKKFGEELKTAKNQKQAQALTNTMLYKLLESSQKNYEASLAFYKLQSEQIKATQNKAKKRTYDEKPVKVVKAEDIKEIKEAKGQPIIYNSAGFPDYEAMKKRYQN